MRWFFPSVLIRVLDLHGVAKRFAQPVAVLLYLLDEFLAQFVAAGEQAIAFTRAQVTAGFRMIGEQFGFAHSFGPTCITSAIV